MSTPWTGRETTPVTLPDAEGGTTAEQMTGPLHAVPAGGEDLARVTSLCNVAVRVWGQRPFDPADADACPVCAERAGAGDRTT